MPSALHEAIIGELVKAGAKRSLFNRWVARWVGGRHSEHEPIPDIPDDDDLDCPTVSCDRCWILWEMRQDRVIPDAFEVDEDNETIVAYEVEVGGRMSVDKMHRYANLWWVLDEYEWTLRLVIVDRFGHRNDVDLCEWSLQQGAQEA